MANWIKGNLLNILAVGASLTIILVSLDVSKVNHWNFGNSPNTVPTSFLSNAEPPLLLGDNSDQISNGFYEESYERKSLSKEEAVDEHWDEIKYYLIGTETISAFSYENGNYYSLEAMISDGAVKEIITPNGNALYFWAEFDRNGNASEIDVAYGSAWDFHINIDSKLVKQAVYSWADDNGLIVQ
ncbi:MAG: hypothetical protein Q7R98_03145 [Candidatus Jorgensenbacteria bacterium]|nr:hypothetical protein [Candidatus Jorgensenbacteria bacterium]